MLHSAGAWRAQAFPTWLPSRRCILLGWGFQCASIPSTKISKDPSTLDFLCQNHASLHWVSKELKSTAKSWIAFAFVWICSKGGKWSHWVHLIASEPWWIASKPGLSCVQGQGSQKKVYSHCIRFPQIQRPWWNSPLLQRLSHWHSHFGGNETPSETYDLRIVLCGFRKVLTLATQSLAEGQYFLSTHVNKIKISHTVALDSTKLFLYSHL